MRKTPEMRRREAKRKKRLEIESDFHRYVEEFIGKIAKRTGLSVKTLLAKYERGTSIGTFLAQLHWEGDRVIIEKLRRWARPAAEKAMMEITAKFTDPGIDPGAKEDPK